MKKIIILTVASLTMALGNTGYAKCTGCHGVAGEKKALGKSAVITGQDVELTIKQLNGYKDGSLNKYGLGGLMKGQSRDMSDEDIRAMAEYISTLK